MAAANSRVRAGRRWSLAGAALTLAAGLAMPAPVAAQQTADGQQPGPRRFAGMQGRGMGPMAFRGLRQLGLTEEQRQQVRDVMQRHREELKAIGTQMRTARQALRAATEGEVVDQAAVRAATGQLADAQAQGSILRSKIRQEVFGLLTPEQQEKAKALRAQAEQRMEWRRQRMQQRFTQRPKGQAPPQ